MPVLHPLPPSLPRGATAPTGLARVPQSRSLGPAGATGVLVALTLLITACVPSSATPDALPGAPAGARWPVRTAEHVDLWLHGFGLVTTDTTPVPLFRRGYRDSLTVVKNGQNAFTTLDANRTELAEQLGSTPTLRNAQFLVFSFNSWESLASAIEVFLRVEGNPQQAPDQQTAAEVAFLAAQFRTPAERTWLRRFRDGLSDEFTAFYDSYWRATQQSRVAVLDEVTRLWESQYRSQFERFLSNTQQRNGTMLVSLPLGPEGRAASDRDGAPVVAVPLPGRVEDAREALLVFAHEVVGSTAGAAVNDHTTPAEKRNGVADRLVAIAQVRGGAMLLEKIAPELVNAYARYYLTQGGHSAPARATDADRMAALVAAYALPEAVANGMRRQIEIALGGI